MPIYEYYCANCKAEYELLRPVSKADETAPCQTCGQPGERQLSSFSFKSDTFTSPKLKEPNRKPLRSYNRDPSPTPAEDTPSS